MMIIFSPFFKLKYSSALNTSRYAYTFYDVNPSIIIPSLSHIPSSWLYDGNTILIITAVQTDLSQPGLLTAVDPEIKAVLRFLMWKVGLALRLTYSMVEAN
jgi:hypothetical protein